MNKGTQLKRVRVSNEQDVSHLTWTRNQGPILNKRSKLKKSQGSQMNKGSQLNKESGVSNEQGVSAEQGVRDLK